MARARRSLLMRSEAKRVDREMGSPTDVSSAVCID
eukprot:CAMPEP_0177293378 /NCGR_PEP_ID=MMETSP0368-20130122/720_1 /TAXON_ID=447022 ORGANISM="Scrippsiella hangoei-like, Strain SHHI-4" /NCGR_SAMPLE_ID=MMETSP0368 /ASSEMBLY_ACC=CAM_ASM_000363 /LENGTH=34 /DNA_ID= /DNA_START= /DNA_END= /DNA_ORIENTATION=